MSAQEIKKGQSIDTVKSTVLTPALIEGISEIPNLGRELSLIDIGSGDATSSNDVVKELIQRGYRIENLALLDADTSILPNMLTTITSNSVDTVNTQVLEYKDRDILRAFLEKFEGRYDIATAQLVLQQIANSAEASHLIYTAYQALKPNGEFLLADLHPKYVDYLTKREPGKFEVSEKEEDGIKGKYHFDSGGTVEIYSRGIPTQLAMFLGLGFDLVKVRPIIPEAVSHIKERYKTLSQEKIPMFYLMQLRKNPSCFVSSTTGIVANIRDTATGWLSVTFADGEEIKIPSFHGWSEVEPGNSLILHEVIRPEADAQIVNYWIVDKEKTTGGQLVANVKGQT